VEAPRPPSSLPVQRRSPARRTRLRQRLRARRLGFEVEPAAGCHQRQRRGQRARASKAGVEGRVEQHQVEAGRPPGAAIQASASAPLHLHRAVACSRAFDGVAGCAPAPGHARAAAPRPRRATRPRSPARRCRQRRRARASRSRSWPSQLNRVSRTRSGVGRSPGGRHRQLAALPQAADHADLVAAGCRVRLAGRSGPTWRRRLHRRTGMPSRAISALAWPR
jgi:hypothetical protein